MRTDPTDTGGLFVRRRPGTAPVHYRDTPVRRGDRRQRVDGTVAGVIAVLMALVSASFWGPLPAGWLWIGSRVFHATENTGLAIAVAFGGMLLTLLVVLAGLKRLDQAWILVRRAAGHDQRTGIIGPVFGVTAIIGATLFTLWLVLIGGLGPSIAPGG